jgi:hypothetical protein
VAGVCITAPDLILLGRMKWVVHEKLNMSGFQSKNLKNDLGE